MLNRTAMWIGVAALLVSTGVLASCRPAQTTTVTVFSSEPLLHLYAEYFNTRHDSIYIDVQHHDNPMRYRTQSIDPPDLIIHKNPAAVYQTSWFRPLNITQPDNTYPQLIDLYRNQTGSTLVPIAFSLPIIVWHDHQLGTNPPLTIGLQQLSDMAAVESAGNRLTHISFSPSWNRSLPMWYLRAKRIPLTFREPGTPSWDPDEIDSVVTLLREWITDNIGSPQQLSRFSETYMYAPYYALLREGRINHYPADLREFFAVPPSLRRNLDFSWYGNSGRIPASPTMLFAAVPHESRNHRAAAHFIEWLLDSTNHLRLMEYTIEEQLPHFGFFGGYSTSISTNERHIPHLFPEMEGKAPVASRLIFPPPVPWYWLNVERMVIEPFFQDALLGDTPLSGSELQRRIDTWLSQLGSG